MREISFSQLTDTERVQYRKIWKCVLDNYCSTDKFGNRPCDRGSYCNLCQHDPIITEHFKHELQKQMKLKIIEL